MSGPYLDTLGMWEAIFGLPEQLAAARRSASSVLGVVTPLHDIRAVVVLGMGSGGAAGDMVAAYGAAHGSVPIWVAKDYATPSFVDERTLVLAVSFSGDTEETLAAATGAAARGAALHVVAGGGALADLAAASSYPLFEVAPELPAARAALGALTVPLLLTLAHHGVVPDASPALSAAYEAVARRRDVLAMSGGPAEVVARQIGRTIPLVYGSAGLGAVAARRWKTQVNQNAKTPAFEGAQPELCHNELAGWGQHGDVTRQVLTLIMLRQPGEHPQVARRFALVAEATDEVMARLISVHAEAESDLACFFNLAFFGDVVSLHLAGLEGIDPGPVPALSDVEAALR